MAKIEVVRCTNCQHSMQIKRNKPVVCTKSEPYVLCRDKNMNGACSDYASVHEHD